jgi:hypothetical protein
LFKGWWSRSSRPPSFSDYERTLLKRIKKHGWTAVGVGPGDAVSPFTYTIGFWETLGSPDIVIAGIDPEPANMILWEAFRRIKGGELKPGEKEAWSGWLQNGDYVWRQVHPSQWTHDNFGSGFWYSETHANGRQLPPPAFQLVSPDFAGVLPWEAGYNEAIRGQQYAFYEPPREQGGA